MSKRSDFVQFFIFMYICNLCQTGVTYTYFYLSKSLPLMQASATFTIMILALPRFTTLIGMIILRKYTDVIPKQMMSLVTALLTIIAFLGLAFAQGKMWFILFALFYGLTILGQGYLSAIFLDRTAPQDRIKIFGYFATSASLSSLFGASLTELLYPLGVHGAGLEDISPIDIWGFLNPLHVATDINPNFMMLAGVILGGVWVISNISVRACEKRLPFYGVESQADKDFVPNFWDYKTPMGLVLLLGVSWMSLMSLVPSFALQLGLEHSSFFFIGFALLAVSGRFFILPKIHQWGRQKVLYIAYFCYPLAFLTLLVLPIFPSTSLLFLAGVFCGLGHGVLFTSLNVIFTEVTPKHTGNAAFVFFIIFYLGCLIMMPVGVFVDILGYSRVFIGLGILVIGMLMLSYRNLKLQEVLQGQNK